MSGDPRRDIDNRVESIKANDTGPDEPQLCDADQDVLLELNEILQTKNERNERFGDHHYRDTLGDCYRMALHTGVLAKTLEDGETGEQAIETILDWVASKDYSAYVDSDYRSALRIFGDLMLDEERDRFLDIEIHRKDAPDPAPRPSEVARWDEATSAADAKERYNVRDPALITTQWAAGTRPMSELWELTVADVDDRGSHMVLSVPDDSKTGSRNITIYAATPYLRRWLQNHPWKSAPDRTFDADTPLWVKTRGDLDHISYTMFKEVFYDAAERAGITKPFNPQHLRASRASVLAATPYMTQVDLENHFGWERGSKSAAHYITRFGGETGKHVGMADGALDLGDDDPAPIAPVECFNCGEYTPRHRDTCLWCPESVDASLEDIHPIAHEHALEEESENLLDLVADGELNADDFRAVQKLEPFIKGRDDFFDRLDEYVAVTERMTPEA